MNYGTWALEPFTILQKRLNDTIKTMTERKLLTHNKDEIYRFFDKFSTVSISIIESESF